MNDEPKRIRIAYVSWRNGRPRFNPGPKQRAAGAVAQDLKHPSGTWYTEGEAREWAALHALGKQTKRAQTLIRKSNRGASFVYVLRCGPLFKVGFSINPWRRVAELQTGIGNAIDFMMATAGTQKDEQELHQQLSGYRQNGEWFTWNGGSEAIVMRRMLKSSENKSRRIRVVSK